MKLSFQDGGQVGYDVNVSKVRQEGTTKAVSESGYSIIM